MSTVDHQLTFDLNAALVNLGGDQDLLQTLAVMFAEDVPSEVREIECALSAQSWNELQLHAHTLKGLCATFSAEPLRGIAHELELGAKHRESVGRLGKLVADIKSLEQATVEELQSQAQSFVSNH